MATTNNDALPDIVITSEDDAYRILEMASLGQIPPFGNIVFDGWPSLNLYLKGRKFDQSLTPTVMKGLLELQRGVYRSYAAAKFDNPSKRLTDAEKDDLEIKVSVGGGSSALEINFPDIATKFIEQMGSRMNPIDLLVTVVSIAVLYFGQSAYRSYLESRKDIRRQEISDETQRRTLEAMTFISEQETKRTEIIANLASKDPRIENIDRLAHDVHTEIVKSMAAGTESKIAGISMSPQLSETLTQNARRKSSEIRLDGEYRLMKLDWSDSLRFKVRVKSVTTGEILDAEVQDESLTGQYKEALKAAEWSRKPVTLSINAKQVDGGSYKDVVIISAVLADK